MKLQGDTSRPLIQRAACLSHKTKISFHQQKFLETEVSKFYKTLDHSNCMKNLSAGLSHKSKISFDQKFLEGENNLYFLKIYSSKLSFKLCNMINLVLANRMNLSSSFLTTKWRKFGRGGFPKKSCYKIWCQCKRPSWSKVDQFSEENYFFLQRNILIFQWNICAF